MLRLPTAILAFFIFFMPLPSNALVTLDEVGTGALLITSTTPGEFVEAPRIASDFDITVTGPIARTRLTQHFVNPTEAWIEGAYVFPLPENAAVDMLKMVIGDRVIIGEIKEKQEAKQIYETAKAEGKKATLLDQKRANIFTNRIANIGPHETILIQIEYQQPVRQSAGTFSLRVPTVVAPRYNPPPQVLASKGGGFFLVSDAVPDRDRIEPPVNDPARHLPVNPLTINVRLNAGFPLGPVKSSYHQTVAKSLAEERQIIGLATTEFADRDFEITWQPKLGAVPDIGLFAETVGGSDYVLALVTPPAGDERRQPMPREVVFVIDNSGSMGGASMRQAKRSLHYALDRLTRKDRFNIIRFDDTMDVMFPDTVPATTENIEAAKRLVARLEASGGTKMIPPLRAALYDSRPHDRRTLRQIIFLTDGAIGNEDQLFEILADRRGRSRIFMVGIGSAPNDYLMTRAAEIGRGTFTHIGDTHQVDTRMRELFVKLEAPAITDLATSFDVADVEMTPETLPDIYRGEPLLLLMKMTERTGSLTLSGTIAGKPWTKTVHLGAEAKPGSGIAKLWARRKIADAEVDIITGAISYRQADREILALALEHHLVSRLTSLVAVDKTPARAFGVPLVQKDIPLNLPAGWDFEKVFGNEQPVFERHAALEANLIATSAVKVTAQQSIMLPEGGTLADLFLFIGVLLSALSALLFIFSRRGRLV